MPVTLKIAVFGSSQPREGMQDYEEARAVGYALARAGYTVVTGGYHGIMEAASLGAKEAGGTTIGVTTDFFAVRNLMANVYIDTEIRVPSYADRLVKLISLSDGYVIMRGGSGTLSELFCSWELVKNGSLPLRPIVLYGDHWKRIIDFLAGELEDELSFSSHLRLLKFADNPGDVIRLLKKSFNLT